MAMEIKAFRDEWSAKKHRRFQGWTTRQAKIRRVKRPGHKWANKHGNIIVLQMGESVLGKTYLFHSGRIEPEYFEDLAE